MTPEPDRPRLDPEPWRPEQHEAHAVVLGIRSRWPDSDIADGANVTAVSDALQIAVELGLVTRAAAPLSSPVDPERHGTFVTNDLNHPAFWRWHCSTCNAGGHGYVHRERAQEEADAHRDETRAAAPVDAPFPILRFVPARPDGEADPEGGPQ